MFEEHIKLSPVLSSVPTHALAFDVLLLQAADDGRAMPLFGDGLPRVREAVPPFLVGQAFPDVYLEFPLAGEPFLDATVLYSKIEPGTRVRSSAAEGTARLFDFCARAASEHENLSWGFELDTKAWPLAPAAVHFQPREALQLVEPFFDAIGEPERARLYLDQARRMPAGWGLSFFGLFRGRPGSPLRVCGYLASEIQKRCVQDATCLGDALAAAGFEAATPEMLAQAASVMEAAPEQMDFQLDVQGNGQLGNTFALDARFGVESASDARQSFADGPAGRLMRLLESLGAADGRWRQAAEMCFARSLPVLCSDGNESRYAFTLFPRWVKARWVAGALQPAKLYCLAKAKLL